jgi:hypothetical protein
VPTLQEYQQAEGVHCAVVLFCQSLALSAMLLRARAASKMLWQPLPMQSCTDHHPSTTAAKT